MWLNKLIGALALISLSAQAEVGAQYRGFDTINQTLKQRIAKPGAAFDMANYLKAPSNNSGGVVIGGKNNLLELLGFYAGSGRGEQFRNGQPNAANSMLWHLLFNGFAQDVGAICLPEPQPPTDTKLADLLHPKFLAQVQALCAWPAITAKDRGVLQAYWNMLVGFDAPPSEFAIWSDFVLKQYGQAPAAQAVSAMTLALLMNPHFLLRK